MAVSRKPVAAEIEALIQKGGTVPEESPPPSPPRKVVPVTLRIPSTLLERVDQHLKSQLVPLPRHTWILEAVQEKLERSADNR